MTGRRRVRLLLVVILALVLQAALIGATAHAAADISNSTIRILNRAVSIMVDGRPVESDVPPFIDPATERTLVPARFVSEALGAQVDWDQATRAVIITRPGHPFCELHCPDRDLHIPGLWLPFRPGPAFTFPEGYEILGGYHGPEEGRWAASGGTVLVGVIDGAAGGKRYLVALDRDLKGEKWRRELSLIAPPVIVSLPPGEPEPTRPAPEPELRLIGVAQLDDDRVIGFRLDTGATLWEWNRCVYPELADDRCGQPHPDDLGSHQVRAAGGLVFFYLDSDPMSLVALDARTGEMLWKLDARDVPFEVKAAYSEAPYGWSRAWTFFLAGEDAQGPVVAVVNVGSAPNSLLVLDGRTGKILWHRKWTMWGHHQIAGRQGLLLSWVRAYDLDYGRDPFVPQNALLAFDLRTGQERWRYETPASEPKPFAVSPQGRIFLGERYRNAAGNMVWRLVALEAGAGQVVWGRDLPGEFSRAFYADERQVLYQLFAGDVRAAKAANGDELQVGANPGTIHVVEANRIYRFKGRTVASFLGSPPPVIRIFVDGREIATDAPPVIVQNRTFVAVRFVSEALGAKVDWDANTRTVIITRPAR